MVLCTLNGLALLKSPSLALYTRYFQLPARFGHTNLFSLPALSLRGPIQKRTPIRPLLRIPHWTKMQVVTRSSGPRQDPEVRFLLVLRPWDS